MHVLNKIMLISVAAGSGVYWWMQEQVRSEYERQVGALASTMDRRLANPLSPSGQPDAQFLRALVILADFRDLKQRGRLNQEEPAFLSDALEAAGYNNPGEILSISRNLKENMGVCQELKIFGDGSGSQAMLTGQAPQIHAGPFKDEPLILVRRLSPQLAPEAVNHPANFTLLPAPAADMIWPYTVNDQVMRTAQELKTAGVLDAATYEAIRRRGEDIKN